MPKAGRKSLCRCRLYCTVFNSATREYEGPGKLVSKATKYLHASDSRRLSITSHGYGPIKYNAALNRNRTNSIDGNESGDTQAVLELILQEFEWMSSWSVTSPTAPLIFVADPSSNGVYVRPSLESLLTANTGEYALKPNSQRNAIFLQVENSYCNMIHRLLDLPPNIGRTAALNLVKQGLVEINQSKGAEWTRIRDEHGHLNSNLVNTG